MIPTSTMRAVSEVLETAGRALRLRQIIEALPAHKPTMIREAVDHLAAERFVVVVEPAPARRPSQIVALLAPYRPEPEPWKPIDLMAKIAAELERSPDPLTASALRDLVHSDRPKLVSEAIARLIVEGYVVERKVVELELVRPYPDLEEAPRAR